MTEALLPIGIQDFETIRSGGFVYVDKTRYLYDLAKPGQGFYFLSRPRRFGKSLTISTLRSLFQGKKDLFEGLWISRQGNWEWDRYPVVIIDFNELAQDTPENLKRSLEHHLLRIAGQNRIALKDMLLPAKFASLLISLSQKAGKPVAVLVDEYDKPIISHLGKGPEALEIARQNREVMKSFFGILKGAHVSPCLRFVFFTGISRFSRVSIFSDLNNLEDISMTEDHADMLGYTQEELVRYFRPHILAMGEKLGIPETEMITRLADYYNGYRFSPKDVRVYNPFSVMSALKQKSFHNFWFETGTPTFLVNLLRERNYPLPLLENLESDEAVFGTYEPENLKPEAILFQTGYITIKDVEDHIYHFDYPNREVKTSFLKQLVTSFIDTNGSYAQFLRLSKYLREESLEEFFETIRAIFAAIPFNLETRRDEAYFHTIFYLLVIGSGVNADSEVLTCEGRIDLVMEFHDRIYIIEFKCNQSAAAALRQIHRKNYADKYRQRGKKIILMGINFDSEKRNVAEWKRETVT